MNCKPGDLAVIVRAEGKSLGAVVRCLQLCALRSTLPIRGRYGWTGPEPIWIIEGNICSFDGDLINYVPDGNLRPIRDPGDEATDETLTWLPIHGKLVTA